MEEEDVLKQQKAWDTQRQVNEKKNIKKSQCRFEPQTFKRGKQAKMH